MEHYGIELLIEICAPLVTGAIIFAAHSLWRLNAKMAVIVERVSGHETRIHRLERKFD